jgi:hypothetical protein
VYKDVSGPPEGAASATRASTPPRGKDAPAAPFPMERAPGDAPGPAPAQNR